MFTVYVLRSEKTGRRYVGSTENLERRFREHEGGQTKSTKGKGPWKLIHTENFTTRADAVGRELFLKSGQGRAWLNEFEKSSVW